MADLYVSRLALSHFRSHLQTSLGLDGRPVALFGPNGAGKTNILEALSLLSPGRGIRRSRLDDMAQSGKNVGWKISAQLRAAKTSHDIETWFEPGANRQVRIDDKPTPQGGLAKVFRVLWLVPSMDRLWIEGAEGRRRFLDRIALSFRPDHAEASVTYEKAMRERNRMLKDQVRDPTWYRAVEQSMAVSGARIMINRAHAVEQLLTAQEQTTSSFPVVDLELLAADGDDLLFDEVDQAQAFTRSRDRDLYAGRTLVGPHRIDLGARFFAKNIEAKQASTGEQKSLLISMVLANARALQQSGDLSPVLLLDEVAAHLDENRRAALYDEICALDIQAFMTGTGPELFVELGQAAQFVEVTEDGGTSACRQVDAADGN